MRKRVPCFRLTIGHRTKENRQTTVPHTPITPPSMLDGILASPLPSRRLVAWAIGFVDVGNLGNERIIRVRVRQHGADGQKD